MKTVEVVRAWGHILRGKQPSLSVEITRECPLRCPGCYAYEEAHLGGNGIQLRTLRDYKGDDLVRRFLALVDANQPLHLSIVGGDPLVRFRELEVILPELERRDIHVQLVTSAFRPLPMSWAALNRLNICVSVDGLQPEHDARRKPATYERILKNIEGHRVTIHCTLTSQMTQRPGYLSEFLEFWSARPVVKKIWFSLFTPQKGATDTEILSPLQRQNVIEEFHMLNRQFPKLEMPDPVVREFFMPPKSPEQCIFAQTTMVISADLNTRVTPCQFGGQPDCSRCGCFASMGLQALGHHKVIPGVTAGQLFQISLAAGRAWRRIVSPPST